MTENAIQEESEKENNMHRGATTYEEALCWRFSHILAHLAINKSMTLGSSILNLQRRKQGDTVTAEGHT